MSSIILDGVEEWLPKDWLPLHVMTAGEDGVCRCYIMRAGRLLPLSEALITRDLLVTSSKPQNKKPLPRDETGW